MVSPKTSDTSHRPNSLLDVVRTLFRWKRPIAISCGIAAAGAVIISLLLPVYYEASTTFLAISPDQAKPELLFGQGTLEPELYGNANDIDRIMSIAESAELVGFMVDSFDLYQHYDVDRENRRAPYYVRKEFFSLYDVTKTKRDAIQLTLEDRNPELAATMVRAAREHIDSLAQRLIKRSQGQTIITYRRNIDNKAERLRVLSDSLAALRQRSGVFNVLAQSESLTSEMATARTRLRGAQARLQAYESGSSRGFRDSAAVLRVMISGMEQEVGSLEEQLQLFNQNVAQVAAYQEEFNEASEALSLDRERLKQYEAAFASDLPAILILEEAEVPLIKSRPHRSLIVIGAVAITFIFSLITVLFIEHSRDIDWKAIYHGR